ncbi:hypothetical protein [Nocardia asteroides]|uniref:hypothetical protein n=1 Tax=Nocardia asteroides TaxID=1824 RepID=UPI0033DAA509
MSKTGAADSGDAHQESVPSAGVDIAAHLRKLIRVLPIALVVAALAGGAVWFVRDGSERTYEASLTAQISQQSIGAVFNELTQPYIVLVTESRVLSDVVKNGLAPSEQDLRPRVSAMTGPAPSLLIIKAQAGSPEQAERLVLAVQQSLDRVGSQMRTEAIARSAADLEDHRRAVEDTFTKRLADDPLRPELSFDARDVAREIEFRQVLGMARLTVISNPRSELVAPHPVQEGLFAALAVLIVVAEGLVLARGVLDRRSGGKDAGAKDDTAQAPAEPAAATPPRAAPVPVGATASRATPAEPAAAVPPRAAPVAPNTTTPRATPVAPATATPPRAAPVPAGSGSRSEDAVPTTAAPFDPETTVLPRAWPRAEPASSSRRGTPGT